MNDKIDQAAERRARWQVALGSVVISSSAVFVRLTHNGPAVDAFYRMLFGGLSLLIFALLQRQTLYGGLKPLIYGSLAALCVVTDLFFWHRSIGIIGPGLATILGNLQVFVLAIVGIAFFKEKVSWPYYLAIPIACIGLYCLVGFKWDVVTPNYQWGVFYGLITAFFYGFYIFFLRKSQSLPNKLAPSANLVWVSFVGAAFAGIVALSMHESFVIQTTMDFTWLFLYGFTSQLLGWVLISRGLPYINISLAGFFILIQPALAFVWDVLLFNRPTPIIEIAGVVITFSAIYLSTISRRTE